MQYTNEQLINVIATVWQELSNAKKLELIGRFELSDGIATASPEATTKVKQIVSTWLQAPASKE